jgi:methylmalonyl-CoA/ethylmalonyl-CoA epimerase
MNRPYIEHIGIIVDNLDRSMSLFERLFHIKTSGIKDMPDVGLRVAQLSAENVDIELIEYTSEADFAKLVMGAEKGLNHISIKVENIESVIRDAEQKGIKTLESFPRPGSRGLVAFFEPATTENILIEICEH